MRRAKSRATLRGGLNAREAMSRHQEACARLVYVPYTVVAGTAQHPTGSKMIEPWDQDRLARRTTR